MWEIYLLFLILLNKLKNYFLIKNKKKLRYFNRVI